MLIDHDKIRKQFKILIICTVIPFVIPILFAVLSASGVNPGALSFLAFGMFGVYLIILIVGIYFAWNVLNVLLDIHIRVKGLEELRPAQPSKA